MEYAPSPPPPLLNAKDLHRVALGDWLRSGHCLPGFGEGCIVWLVSLAVGRAFWEGGRMRKRRSFFRRDGGSPILRDRSSHLPVVCCRRRPAPRIGRGPSAKSFDSLAGMRYTQKMPRVSVNLANSSSSRAHTHASFLS